MYYTNYKQKRKVYSTANRVFLSTFCTKGVNMFVVNCMHTVFLPSVNDNYLVPTNEEGLVYVYGGGGIPLPSYAPRLYFVHT